MRKKTHVMETWYIFPWSRWHKKSLRLSSGGPPSCEGDNLCYRNMMCFSVVWVIQEANKAVSGSTLIWGEQLTLWKNMVYFSVVQVTQRSIRQSQSIIFSFLFLNLQKNSYTFLRIPKVYLPAGPNFILWTILVNTKEDTNILSK